MQQVLSLACIRMKLTPEEAINACTINTAYTLGLLSSHGSITKGKIANLFITRPMPSLAYMPYAFGANHIAKVVLRGGVAS
jgi:imidazolonepropionase